MSKFIYLSKEGYDKITSELEELKTQKRPELSNKISEARDFGDLKENAEYHAAKEALSHLETRIAKLQETISKARVIEKKDITDQHVSIYTTVQLFDIERNMQKEYTLVSEEESNFQENKISTSSPVGRALLGKKIDEIVEINVPAGMLRFQVKNIKMSI
ncbi:transcription elongation factor GreA [Thermoplasmatales archaeon SG8-52-4]|nr:MAG: transcription elongation factor GreA [Thermoplasmatales archaeon SG8-52-4]